METLLIKAVCKGDLSEVRRLVEEEQVDPKRCVAGHEWTPLHLSCMHGHLSVVRYLVREVDDEGKRCDPECVDEAEDGSTPLHVACAFGRLRVVTFLTEKFLYRVNRPNKDGMTPLHLATMGGHVEVVKHLVENCEADPSCVADNGKTPFHLATESLKGVLVHKINGYLEIAKYLLLECKCSMDDVEASKSLLIWACQAGLTDVAKFFVDSCKLDPKFKTVDIFGETPLHCAIVHGNWETAKYLLLGCKCKPSCKDGEDLVLWACDSNCTEVVQYLNDSSFYEDGSTPLHWVVQWGVLRNVEFMIENCKADPNCVDDNGKTPLQLITEKGCQLPIHKSKGYLEVAEYLLLECKCSMDNVEAGRSLVLWACQAGLTNLVNLIVNTCKLDPRFVVKFGKTLVNCAIVHNNLETAKYLLLECQCQPLLEDGKYLLLWACDNNCIELVQYLNDPSFYEDGITPLHWAVKLGVLKYVKFVIENCKPDPNIVDGNGKTPLHWAIEMGNAFFLHVSKLNRHFEIAEYLILECKCNIDAVKAGKLSLTKWASCEQDRIGLLKYLTKKCKLNANFNMDEDKRSPLSYAIKRHNWEAAKYLLLECQCQPLLEDGKYLLLWACDNNCIEVVQYLNDPSFYEDGSTPLHRAVQMGDMKIIKHFPENCNFILSCVDRNGMTPIHLAMKKLLFTEKEVFIEIIFYLLMISFGSDESNLLYLQSIDLLRETCNILDPRVNVENENLWLKCALEDDDWDIAKYLLLECRCKPTIEDAKRLLIRSCEKECIEVVKYLSCHGDGSAPLHWAVQWGELKYVKFVIRHCSVDPNCVDRSGKSPLHLAIEKGNVFVHESNQYFEIAEYLFLELKCNIDSVDANKSLLVKWASCEKGRICLLKYLTKTCKLNANFNMDEDKRSPLSYAIKRHNWEAAQYLLLECQCQPLLEDGKDLLLWACDNNCIEIVQYLNDPSFYEDGSTLHWAVQMGDMRIIKYLTEKCNFILNCVDRNGMTPIHLAMKKLLFTEENSYIEIVLYLLKLKFQCHLLYYMYSVVQDILHETCIMLDPRVNVENENLWLKCAIEDDDWDIAKYLLLECRCKPSIKDTKRLLVWSCEKECIEVVKYLNVFSHYQYRSISLPQVSFFVIKAMDQEVFEYLLLNCKCKLCQKKGNIIVLSFACQMGMTNVLKDLIESWNVRLTSKATVLYIAIENWEMAKYILKGKLKQYENKSSIHAICNWCIVAMKNLYDPDHYPDEIAPLHRAVKRHALGHLKFMIESCGYSPNCENLSGITPLHLAIQNCNWEAAKYLVLECECKPALLDREKLVIWACDNDSTDVVKYLNNENSLLHCAVEWNSLKAIQFMIEICKFYPNCVNNNGETPVQLAIKKKSYGIMNYLLECKCGVSLETRIFQFQLSCEKGWKNFKKCLIKICSFYIATFFRDGSTPLIWAVKECSLEIAIFMIESCVYDPRSYGKEYFHEKHWKLLNYFVRKFQSPKDEIRHCKSEYELIELLIHYMCKINTGLLLCILELCCIKNWSKKLIYWIETYKFKLCVSKHNGAALLTFAVLRDYWEIVEYLTVQCHCKPRDDVMKKLIKWAIKSGCTEVTKSLNARKMESGSTLLHWAVEFGNVADLMYIRQTCKVDYSCHGYTPLHRAVRGDNLKNFITTLKVDPNIVDKSGRTCLHLAVQLERIAVLDYLINSCNCNLNSKTNDGYTPLMLAMNNPDITRLLVKAGASCNTTLPQTYVKVFIVGKFSSGKSSLTKALQSELAIEASQTDEPQLVQDVQPMTAGIVPSQFSSKKYGRVIFYDTAGQQEYYASHAALLQNTISSYPPLFIIVVNLCYSKDEIKQTVVHWMSFLANQCKASLASKPYLIIVGSHKDVIESGGQIAEEKVDIDFLRSLPSLKHYHFSGFISMDCRQSNSCDIDKLAKSMKNSCDALRKQVEKAYHLHHLSTVLLKTKTPITVNEAIDRTMQAYNTFITRNPHELYKDLCELSDRGEILLLKSPVVSDSWVIFDQALLMSEIDGVLFAPEEFKQHCNLANATGVVQVSKISERFPHYDSDMLVQFLILLEFCCEINDDETLQIISQGHLTCYDVSNERYLFFPGLVSMAVSSNVWNMDSQFSQTCGWVLQCSEAGQFFTSQFLQVLLLRIAFFCALAPDSNGLPVLQRKCSIWKGGIFWSTREGVQALMEIRDPPQNKEVLLLFRCRLGREVQCAHLCSTVVKMALKIKNKFCHTVPTKEFLLHTPQLVYPCKQLKEHENFSITEVSMAIKEGKPDIVNSLGNSSELRTILPFEPYASLGWDIIRQLFQKDTESLFVSDKFLYDIAERIHNKKDLFIEMLKLSHSQLDEKIRQVPPGRFNEFVCVLQCWRGDSGTYQSLRETLDQFSVFAGRNPLVSCIYTL